MHLGQMGSLVEIDPLIDIDMSAQRYGNVHRAIGGRVTVDTNGFRESYRLRWVQLDSMGSTMEFLEALHHRLIPGPIRLLFPSSFRKNRFSRLAASGQKHKQFTDRPGLELSGSGVLSESEGGSASWQPDGSFLGHATGVEWSGAAAGDGVQVDEQHWTPTVEGEDLTASFWVKSTAADELQIEVEEWSYDAGYTSTGTHVGTATTLTADVWTRLEYTWTVPAGSDAVVVNLRTPNQDLLGTVSIGGVQLEQGSTATAWRRGGGSPRVVVDQMSVTGRWAPYADVELTLLES